MVLFKLTMDCSCSYCCRPMQGMHRVISLETCPPMAITICGFGDGEIHCCNSNWKKKRKDDN